MRICMYACVDHVPPQSYVSMHACMHACMYMIACVLPPNCLCFHACVFVYVYKPGAVGSMIVVDVLLVSSQSSVHV